MKSTASSSVKATQKKASVTAPNKPVATKKPTAKPATASKKSAAKPATTRKKSPTYEDISHKAHEIYMERMRTGEPGNSESDWHKAVDLL